MRWAVRRPLLALRGALLCVLMVAAGPVSVAEHPPDALRVMSGEGSIEETLVRITGDIDAANIERALLRVEALIESRPNFLLAQLIKGDLLLSRARAIDTLGAVPNVQREDAQALRDEARTRIAAYRDKPPQHLMPRALVQLGAYQEHALLVDAGASRLYVFGNDNGKPRLLHDYYISQGKAGFEKARAGDKRTPLGVYRIIEKLPQASLSDFYGSGAWALDYPNEWDRRNGRSGSGIWLHGTPSDTFSRPPRASEGCVVLSNADLKKLETMLSPGQTPVVIVPHIEWVSTRSWNAERDALLAEIEAWRVAREGRDVETFSRHYAQRMHDSAAQRESWLKGQRDWAAGQGRLRLALSDITLLRDPKEELFVASFEQDATTDAGSRRSRVRQVWLREAGHWKILAEEGAQPVPLAALTPAAPLAAPLSSPTPRSVNNEKTSHTRRQSGPAAGIGIGASWQPHGADENQPGLRVDRTLSAAGAEVGG